MVGRPVGGGPVAILRGQGFFLHHVACRVCYLDVDDVVGVEPVLNAPVQGQGQVRCIGLGGGDIVVAQLVDVAQELKAVLVFVRLNPVGVGVPAVGYLIERDPVHGNPVEHLRVERV